MKLRVYPNLLFINGNNQATVVVLFIFLPLFFHRRGFDQSAIGAILAVGPFVSLFAQPFWGAVGDRFRNKNLILTVQYLGSSASILFFYISGDFAFALLVMIVVSFFQVNIEPMTTTVVLEHTTARGWRYGPIRMAGTIGYSVMALIAGTALTRNINACLVIFASLSLLGVVFILQLPRSEEPQKRRALVSPGRLLRNPRVMLYLGFTLVLSSTIQYYFSFFPIYFEEMGATPLLLGIGTFISATPEIAFLLFADKILAMVGVDLLLIGAGSVLMIRWLLLYLLHNPYLILPFQVLHAFSGIVIVFSVTVYIAQSVPDELKASGQAFFALAATGLARIIGPLFGGWFGDRVGIRTMFLYCSIFVAVATVLFAFARLSPRRHIRLRETRS